MSNLEGLILRWLLAAVVEANHRGALDAAMLAHVDALSAWMRSPGVTPRARAEIECGMSVRTEEVRTR